MIHRYPTTEYAYGWYWGERSPAGSQEMRAVHTQDITKQLPKYCPECGEIAEHIKYKTNCELRDDGFWDDLDNLKYWVHASFACGRRMKFLVESDGNEQIMVGIGMAIIPAKLKITDTHDVIPCGMNPHIGVYEVEYNDKYYFNGSFRRRGLPFLAQIDPADHEMIIFHLPKPYSQTYETKKIQRDQFWVSYTIVKEKRKGDSLYPCELACK